MQFDAPSPQQRSGHDFSANPLGNSQPITYRAGTLEEAAAATRRGVKNLYQIRVVLIFVIRY